MNFIFIFNGSNSSQIGGGDMHGILLANHLAEKKEEVLICKPRDVMQGVFRENVKLSCYKNIPFEKQFFKNNFSLFFLYIVRVFLSILKIKNIKKGLFVLSSHIFHDTLPILFLSSRNRKFVVYIHHIISEQNRKGVSAFIVSVLEHLSFFIIKYKKAHIITVSKEVSNQLINKYSFSRDKITFSSNGVDPKILNTNKLEKKFDLVFCGRLVPSKGIVDLLEIVAIIKNNTPNISCAIIGSGPLENFILETRKNNGLENNITMLGYVSEEEKIDIISSSKILVLPSHEEGWGIVIAEAMACGVPVITYRLSEIKSVWEDSVLWVDPFDKDDFVNNVNLLLKNELECARMSKQGLEFIKRYSWEEVFLKETLLLKNLYI